MINELLIYCYEFLIFKKFKNQELYYTKARKMQELYLRIALYSQKIEKKYIFCRK